MKNKKNYSEFEKKFLNVRGFESYFVSKFEEKASFKITKEGVKLKVSLEMEYVD